MKKSIRILLSFCAVGVVLALSTPCVVAQTTSTPHHIAPKVDSRVEAAQTRLQHLGYYQGKIDGVMGPKTKEALKEFQAHHNLKATGKLTTATYKALEHADVMEPPTKNDVQASAQAPAPAPATISAPAAPEKPDFYKLHPDFYGYYNQQYANPMMLGPPSVQSRFAHIDVHEKITDAVRSYDVTLNTQALFSVADQSSVIGISRTFSLGNEDLIIFTTYRAQSNICNYRHYLLTVSQNSNRLVEIENCSRGYKANPVNTSLFITFADDGNSNAARSTWRYENGDLEKL